MSMCIYHSRKPPKGLRDTQSVSFLWFTSRCLHVFWIVFLISSLVIDIHGGAFMLGSSDMVNKDQIQDCLNRGWIVLVPNHRLCPQVDLLDGPMRDCRDLLAWVYDGGLQDAVSSETNIPYSLDLDHVFAFGTSS